MSRRVMIGMVVPGEKGIARKTAVWEFLKTHDGFEINESNFHNKLLRNRRAL